MRSTQFARHSPAATWLAVAAVIIATLSVACALAAQVLTITHRLNPANLIEVEAWYHRQFTVRASATGAATILLILAAILADATAAATLLTAPRSVPCGGLTVFPPDRAGLDGLAGKVL